MISVLFFFSAHIGAADLSARREPLTPYEEQYNKLVYEVLVKTLKESKSPEEIQWGHALQNHMESLMVKQVKIKEPDGWKHIKRIISSAAVCIVCFSIMHWLRTINQNVIDTQQNLNNRLNIANQNMVNISRNIVNTNQNMASGLGAISNYLRQIGRRDGA